MKKKTPISEIMTTSIISVDKSQTLTDVADLIDEHNFRHVPVVSGKKIVGMLSQVDLGKISFINTFDGLEMTDAMFDALTIDQVMTRSLTTVQASDTIYDVALNLSESEFHALPVLDGEELVGIVTSTDLIKYLVAQF